jgi:flagellar protein FliO/FliZ
MSLIFFLSFSAQAAEVAAEAASEPAVAAVEAVASPGAEGEKDVRSEAEIPLNLDANKKAATEGSSVFRILFTLSILGLVGAGAYVFLRKYSVPKAMKHQTQIKVLQQHYLGPKKSLAIVRVAGESILIGVTEHNISMIKPLSLLDDEIPEEAPESFGRVLGSQRPQADFDEPRGEERKTKTLDADEEFAISGIKDIVSKRLKGMRSLQ